MKSIHKIVLTGGVCAGKSSALARIKEHFTERGWVVIVVPESATTLILSGITPYNKNNIPFQYSLLTCQHAMEMAAIGYARRIKDERILIVFDRGIPDGAAFVNEMDWSNILGSQNMNRFSSRDSRYDAVIHMVTVAKGKPEFYTRENNLARTETVEQAIELDDKLIDVWMGHPHLRVIDNSTDFPTKISRCISEISKTVGDPVPIETERKFLVQLRTVPKTVRKTKASIIQTYITTGNSEERIRCYGRNGSWVYIHTTKCQIPGDQSSRYETERLISHEEYVDHLPTGHTYPSVKKTRMYDLYDGNYLEIDQYTEYKKNDETTGSWAIVEVETSSTGEIKFPEWITVIREVTTESKWKNANLAVL